MHDHPSFFQPGQTIVLREIWHGKIWSARPYIVVRDRPELTVLAMPESTVIKYPVTPRRERITAKNRLNTDWILIDDPFNRYTLRFSIPGADYSVLLFWDMPGMKHHLFYINFEEPLTRTSLGFDYLDQFLDVIIKPDLSSWRWKDEDEFAEAVDLGLVSRERAAAMHAEGERVAKWIQSGSSPFNGWENWRPDPAWQTPVLPEGWDKL